MISKDISSLDIGNPTPTAASILSPTLSLRHLGTVVSTSPYEDVLT